MKRTGAPPWAREQLKLRRTFDAWIAEEVDTYEKQGFQALFGDRKGHALDEIGGYTRSFVGAYCVSGDARIPQFMVQFRDDWFAAVSRSGHFEHGYDANENGDYITHTAEAFTQFLLNVLYLDITDGKTVELVDRAASNLGNWNPGVQEFYDWDRHVFRSYFLGTKSPYHRPPYDFQSPRHFRVLQIALAAYEATGNPRYLDLCNDYCGFYQRAILDAPADMDAPTHYFLIGPEELERYAQDPAFRDSYRFRYYDRYAEAADRGEFLELDDGSLCLPNNPIGDLEPPYHVLHDPMMTWLEICKHTPDADYRRTLRRLMAGWVGLGPDLPSQIAGTEPHCGVHLPKYRDFTGDTSLDGVYLDTWPDGACSYLLTGDEDRLLGTAAAAEALFARSILRNRGQFGAQFATDHACNVVSIAGTTSADVAPALFMPLFGGLNVHYGRAPWVNVLYYTDGEIGLPENVAALYVPAVDGGRAGAKLANLGSTPHTVGLRPVDPTGPENIVLTAPASGELIHAEVQPGEVKQVEFQPE